MNTIHDFKIESLEGDMIDFADFVGKKIIIVNVASECGYTPQYQQLQELYETFQQQLVIVGMPCNDFGGQEPGTAETIRNFCTKRYGVTFPLSSKVSIEGLQHPIYKFLTHQSENGVLDHEITWNFHKFLLDEKGHLVAAYPSATSPFDEQITNWISS